MAPGYDRPQDLHTAQIDFLLRAYYPVNYLVQRVRSTLLEDIALIQSRDADQLIYALENLEAHERHCLEQIFVENHSLDGRLLALQDADNDDIKDFRINYYGEFFENDSDADNDGIDNTFDTAPFDAQRNTVSDSDRDSLPDHLDWSNPALYTMSDHAQRIQQQLHQDFGLLLVEGNHSFTATMAEVVDDVMYRVFNSYRSHFKERDTLKYIISNKRPYIPADEAEFYGAVHTGTKRMYLFATTFDTLENEKTHIAALLTLVHELVHALQFDMDYPQNLSNHLQTTTENNVPEFIDTLNSLGWSIDPTRKAVATEKLYSGFMFNEASHVAFNQHFGRGDLRIDIGELAELDASDEALDRAYGVINAYSLTNIWEWHAEYVSASVLQRLLDTTRTLLDASRYAVVLQCLEQELESEYGQEDTYRLDHARPDIMDSLASDFPISSSDLEYLAKRYIIVPYSQCSA